MRNSGNGTTTGKYLAISKNHTSYKVILNLYKYIIKYFDNVLSEQSVSLSLITLSENIQWQLLQKLRFVSFFNIDYNFIVTLQMYMGSNSI